MTKQKTTAKAKPPASPTSEELDAFWLAANTGGWMTCAESEMIDRALSGDDIPAAGSYFAWFSKSVRDGKPMSEDVRAYACAALARFGLGALALGDTVKDKKTLGKSVTLGQAFGFERHKKGNPPTRFGAVYAINGLIAYLHEQGYSISTSNQPKSGMPSAFDVAAMLIERKWKKKFSPRTLQVKHWSQRTR